MTLKPEGAAHSLSCWEGGRAGSQSTGDDNKLKTHQTENCGRILNKDQSVRAVNTTKKIILSLLTGLNEINCFKYGHILHLMLHCLFVKIAGCLTCVGLQWMEGGGGGRERERDRKRRERERKREREREEEERERRGGGYEPYVLRALLHRTYLDASHVVRFATLEHTKHIFNVTLTCPTIHIIIIIQFTHLKSTNSLESLVRTWLAVWLLNCDYTEYYDNGCGLK